MWDYTWAEWIGLVIAVLGLFGFPALLEMVRRVFFLRRRGRAILRLKRSSIFARRENFLSIVISTSSNRPEILKPEPVEAPLETPETEKKESMLQYSRPAVSIWTTYAVTYISELCSQLGYRKSFEADICEKLTKSQDNDLVFIGGPVKSPRARTFVELFEKHHPSLQINRKRNIRPKGEASYYEVTIGSEKFVSEIQSIGTNVVSDIVILMMWRNPFISRFRWRRGIMCAGFTSMGTSGAAQYLNDSLQDGSLRKLCRQAGLGVFSFQRPPEFIMVLDVQINNDSYLDIFPRKIIPIHQTETSS